MVVAVIGLVGGLVATGVNTGAASLPNLNAVNVVAPLRAPAGTCGVRVHVTDEMDGVPIALTGSLSPDGLTETVSATFGGTTEGLQSSTGNTAPFATADVVADSAQGGDFQIVIHLPFAQTAPATLQDYYRGFEATWTQCTPPAAVSNIFGSQTPAVAADVNDTKSVTVGVAFTTSSDGDVTGVRFYKGPSNTGTHVGELWDSSGNLLESVDFTDETASGWQDASFTSPVAVTAGSTYVASYFAPDGEYAYTHGGLTDAVSAPPLTALGAASSPEGNGLYAYGASPTYPTSTYQADNYYVDVDFTTSAPPPAPPGAPTDVTAVGGDAAATVRWTPPTDPVTSYTVTSSMDDSQTVAAPSTTVSFTGLTNGTSYTFTVTATNNAGTGPPSLPSNPVTPSSSSGSPPGLLPGESVLPNGAPSYEFGTQSTIDYGSPNVDNLPSVQASLAASNLTLLREWFNPPSWGVDDGTTVASRLATIKNSGMTCMADLTGGDTADIGYYESIVPQLYAAGCRIFEIGNEPDGYSNGGSIAAYTTFWNTEVPLLRALAPGAVFGGPVLQFPTSNDGTASPYPDDMAYFLAETAASGVRADFISYHHYACTGYTSESQCIADTPGTITAGWNHVEAEEEQYYGATVPTGLSEWNYDPGTGTLGAFSSDSSFIFRWTETMLQTIENDHMAFANEFTTLNYSGYGALDMFGDSSPYAPTAQYYAMVDMGERAGTGSTVVIPAF